MVLEQLREILFIDIETVPTAPTFDMLSPGLQAEWIRKARSLKNSSGEISDPATLFAERSGIFSEFAKVVCIGLGSIQIQDSRVKLRLKYLVNDDERRLLTDFCGIISKLSTKDPRFCGHNIKEFDIPFLCRRMVINNIRLPDCLNVSAKKPWEVSHLDTLEMWRFGDHKNFTALSLIAEVLGIPSPKTDLDGSMVASVYWEDKNLSRIGTYCLNDVLTAARVFLKLKGDYETAIEPVFVAE